MIKPSSFVGNRIDNEGKITIDCSRMGGVGACAPRCGGNGGATLPLLLFKLRSFVIVKLFALPLLDIAF